jgi:hydrogenase maturation factor
MLVSADPITGVSERIGEYAINVSANDVATSGNRPQFAETVVLLPEGAGRELLRQVATQMDATARRLGITIVGGHTEVTPRLRKPIVAVTAFCFAKSYTTSADAQPGDSIMMTKTAGLEGTAVLAGVKDTPTHGVSERTLRRARDFLARISVVEEPVTAYGTGVVHAMHDCTEGGVLGAAYEMSLASEVGFSLEERLVPVAPETREICEGLSLDPLKLIGSGSLLLAVKAGEEGNVKKALRSIGRVTRIGQFVARGRRLARADGRLQTVRAAPEDELWRGLRRIA